MNPIQCNCRNAAPAWPGPVASSTDTSSQLTQTQLAMTSESRDVELNLTTKEGDKVSLSLEARSQALYLNYLEAGNDKEQEYARQLQLFAAESEQDFTMTVEGDLNEEERKEIGKILKTIDRMMASFVKGRIEPMLAKADKLTELDTIAGLSLEMSYSRNVLVAQQTENKIVSTPQGITYDPRGKLAEPPTTTAVPPSTADHPAAKDTGEADALAEAMAKHLAQVNEFADRLLGAVKQIFDKYRQQVEKLSPNNAAAPALIDRIQEGLLARMLKEQAAPVKEEENALA
jgi:hypothetical protein